MKLKKRQLLQDGWQLANMLTYTQPICMKFSEFWWRDLDLILWNLDSSANLKTFSTLYILIFHLHFSSYWIDKSLLKFWMDIENIWKPDQLLDHVFEYSHQISCLLLVIKWQQVTFNLQHLPQYPRVTRRISIFPCFRIHLNLILVLWVWFIVFSFSR